MTILALLVSACWVWNLHPIVEVWNAAKTQDFVIVTRDADFEEQSLV